MAAKTKRKVGRPSLGLPDAFLVRFTKHDGTRLRAEAFRRNLRPAEYLRQIVLARHNQKRKDA